MTGESARAYVLRLAPIAVAAMLPALLPPASHAGAADSAANAASGPRQGGGGPMLEEVVVVGVTPTRASGRSPEEIARHLQSATDDELARMQSLDLTEFMSRHFASVSPTRQDASA